jgi:RNA polymerase sigma-70 factor (ECF subfamily)
MAETKSDPASWFAAEIQPHEKRLRVYLRARFPALRDFDDLIQETYARVMRAYHRGQVTSPKALLFITARNAAYDLYRHQRVVPMERLSELDGPSVIEERPDAAELASREQETQLVQEAIRSLPERCRQVFTLRKIYGLSYKEIAAQLGISERTVNAQVTFGIERCRQFLAGRGVAREKS